MPILEYHHVGIFLKNQIKNWLAINLYFSLFFLFNKCFERFNPVLYEENLIQKFGAIIIRFSGNREYTRIYLFLSKKKQNKNIGKLKAQTQFSNLHFFIYH